jgi:hypothetical protein
LRSKEVVLWYGVKPGARMLLQEEDSPTGDWQTNKPEHCSAFQMVLTQWIINVKGFKGKFNYVNIYSSSVLLSVFQGRLHAKTI